jgi:hypothetical protein
VTGIYYEAVGFPTRLSLTPSQYEHFSLAEIAWAAATVGHTPFSSPAPLPDLAFEMTWRVSMVWANLTPGNELRRSAAYQRLDPSEKSAVSFFLGQVQAKLFAHRLFGVAVFAHVDTVLERLGHRRARTRPDFVGINFVGTLALAVEAKGRTNGWTQPLVTRAKNQSRSLPGVLGVPALRYAHVAYFDRDEWCARLADPPRGRVALADVAAGDIQAAYYAPLSGAFALLKQQEQTSLSSTSMPSGYQWVAMPQARCFFGMTADPLGLGGVVVQALSDENSTDDQLESFDDQVGQGVLRFDPQLFFEGKDGTAILLDPSWREWAEG